MSELIHLLLDLENVQPSAAEIERVRGAHFRLCILHGPHQNHFAADQVKALQPLGPQVRYVQSTKNGRNALDLHVAFTLGEACEQDRRNGIDSRYVIVSADKDFDALFGYLKEQGIKVGRSDTLLGALRCAQELGNSAAACKVVVDAPALSANATRLLKEFKAHPRTRPSTEKKLRNQIASFLALEVTDPEVGRVLAELKKGGFLALAGTKVQYSLATAKA